MAARLVEIYGVVDEGGGGGDAYAPYHKNVQFKKWREVGGEISSVPLYVKYPCKKEEIRAWMRNIKAGNMLHMEIRFTKQYVKEQLRGKVINYHGKTRKDKELLASAVDKRPTTIKVKGFSPFQLDRSDDGYATTVTVGKRKVCLLIESDRKPTVQKLAEKLQEQGVFKAAYQKRFIDVIEDDMLQLKNEDWLDEGDKPVTAAKFRRSFKLAAVNIESNGSYEFIFDDGDQFCGHDIVVRGTLRAGPKHADLFG